MTSIQFRDPYSPAELRALYPAGLSLRQVQILLRHGERTPITWRFSSAGLPQFWPYCRHASTLRAALLDSRTQAFTEFEWSRHLETFASEGDDSPVPARGPGGAVANLCDYGMLTDEGRRSTYTLGQRLRSLYVDRLGFLPKRIESTEGVYLRATPIPRALESMQQVFLALYPPDSRSPDMAPPNIVSRVPAHETLYPNDSHCRRLAHLSRQFAKRAGERWDHTPEMRYVTSKIGKWMPPAAEGGGNQAVAVGSKPSLVGVMDTVNSTLAHGPATRLPTEFYDEKMRRILDTVAVEEWFAGYLESNEYRRLGIGSLMGDVVERMVGSAQATGAPGAPEPVKLALSGCHDTTLAAVVGSIGGPAALRNWPPFTSHIALELFSKDGATAPFREGAGAEPIRRTSTTSPEWSSEMEKALGGWYVRVRYNDEPVVVPGCRAPGKHLDGDVSFCTLAAFKSVVDKFTPTNWRKECQTDITGPAFPSKPEEAGY
ncbi:related to lysophosphatidic acid phosphatase [Cephalotrichum gorgonifer]|uniref:3-phytase n=1 Tax=Cephalotrichum gorgonifer TaxID=2041049 RepID=A0AAE8MVY6_9PEZI|nr:related to lysophosphatidic acid phosphatase [Cephalotrichum gorgonifer]